MQIYTLNVSQGQFVVVVGTNEAFVVDTFVPLSSQQDTIFVKGALAQILEGKHLIGLMVTGFDADHFCEAGMKLVLNKYRPDWLMYPKYKKETDVANKCFSAIKLLEGEKSIKRHSVSLTENNTRFYTTLSKEFTFEVFSPHKADMNSSNNCSLVCRVKERATGATYLVTGDTENDRWDTIVKEFGTALKCDVLAAAHHGSENGITEAALKIVDPHTIVVSAGVDNAYGHPHASARTLFGKYSQKWYRTNRDKGISFKTVINKDGVNTTAFVLKP